MLCFCHSLHKKVNLRAECWNKSPARKIFLIFGMISCIILAFRIPAGVMELADVPDSKSGGGDTVPVRPRSPAPIPRSFERGIFLCGTNFSQPGCAETFFALKVSSREHRTTRVGILTKLPPSLLWNLLKYIRVLEKPFYIWYNPLKLCVKFCTRIRT